MWQEKAEEKAYEQSKELENFNQELQTKHDESQYQVEEIHHKRVSNQRKHQHASEIRYKKDADESIMKAEIIDKEIEKRRFKSRQIKEKDGEHSSKFALLITSLYTQFLILFRTPSQSTAKAQKEDF